MTKLLKSKFYIIDMDTKKVDTTQAYERFWDAVEDEDAKNRHPRYTALRGSHILKHLDVWIIEDQS